jgi:hypothetical protein
MQGLSVRVSSMSSSLLTPGTAAVRHAAYMGDGGIIDTGEAIRE